MIIYANVNIQDHNNNLDPNMKDNSDLKIVNARDVNSLVNSDSLKKNNETDGNVNSVANNGVSSFGKNTDVNDRKKKNNKSLNNAIQNVVPANPGSDNPPSDDSNDSLVSIKNDNKNNKKIDDTIYLGNILLFSDYTDIDKLLNDVRVSISNTSDVKYIIFKNCISRTIPASALAQLYSEISSLVASGKIVGGVLFNSSMNDIFLKLPLIESGLIKIDLQLDKVTGVPELIDSLNSENIKEKAIVNRLIGLLEVLRYDYRTSDLNYDSRLQRKEKIDEIISGHVCVSANYARYLEEMLNKCTASPSVRSVEVNLTQSVLSNDIVDLLMLKFPNCKIIKSTKPVERSLVEYIQKNYIGVIPPYNIVVMDAVELESLIKPLTNEDRDLVRRVVMHIADVDSRNHIPLLNAVRLSVGALKSSKEDSFKAKRVLEYLLYFPIGDTKIKFNFGDSALGRHIDAFYKIADIVQPGMNIDQKKAIINYFVSLLTTGKIGTARIPFFVGPPGSGKSISIAVVGAMIGYLHWFLPNSPDKYINPTDADIKSAIEFGIDAGSNFVTIFSLSSVAGKAAIDGGLRIYVGSDVGLLKSYCKRLEFGGKVYPLLFMGILFDEVDKTNKTGAHGEPPLLYSLMPFANTDTKSVDLYAELIGHIAPVVSIFAANEAPDEFEALWNRTNKVSVPGFSNVQKRDLIFRVFKDVVNASFPDLKLYRRENGDICINTTIRELAGLGAWIIISNDSFNTIINASGDDAGLRALKDNLGSVLSTLSFKSSKNLAKNDHSTIIVNRSNVSEYLPFIVSDKKINVAQGSAVCALGARGQKKAFVVKCVNNDGTAQTKALLSPGPIQKQNVSYHLSSVNGGSDVGHLTFNALLEILKNPTSSYKDINYMHISKKIKSLDNAHPNTHWFIDVEYDVGDKDSPRVAGLAGSIAYVSKLLGKGPVGFAIGYCESDGAFRAVDNAPECFNLCVNKMVDLDKLDAGTHEKIVVVLPRMKDGSDPYEKLAVPSRLRPLIDIKQADNIFDIIKYLMPDFNDNVKSKK